MGRGHQYDRSMLGPLSSLAAALNMGRPILRCLRAYSEMGFPLQATDSLTVAARNVVSELRS
jgi:hypothetical protein